MIVLQPERTGLLPLRIDKQARRGITLIETMVVMTGVAAMLGLCITMLQLLMKLDAESRARLDGAAAIARLADQFRSDVHGAAAARLAGPPGEANPQGRLRIETGPDRTIEYDARSEGKVVRAELRNGTPIRREVYSVPSSGPARVSLRSEGPLTFAALALDRRSPRRSSDPSRLYEVVALVGKNRSRTADAGGAGGGR